MSKSKNSQKEAVIAATVDEYLQSLPAEQAALLEKVRKAIKTAAPKAEEVISYRIPTYKQKGALVHFAAFKNHCSLVVPHKDVLETFAAELKPFKINGVTIHFTPENPLPASIVQKIVKMRIKQNEALISPSAGKQDGFTAKAFVEKLYTFRSDAELKKIQRYFKSGKGQYGESDEFIGVRMGQVFALAKEFIEMTPFEIERLLKSPVHEVRAGAMSIMDKQARSKKTDETRRKELYELYMRRHDRINNWDLVDLAAIHVVGRYLFNKPRNILYRLARSKNVWERRTAIVSTAYFLQQGDRDDTFKIAEMLVKDQHDLVHKAAGGWIRQAGKGDRNKLLSFLDKHAATMPRTMLRYAIEHLDKKSKADYMSRGKD
jgi:3-methyladenine DNA glycosylase AlkD/uncharacterized protein YdhG (YjbR/CyaY superfamily)